MQSRFGFSGDVVVEDIGVEIVFGAVVDDINVDGIEVADTVEVGYNIDIVDVNEGVTVFGTVVVTFDASVVVAIVVIEAVTVDPTELDPAETDVPFPPPSPFGAKVVVELLLSSFS
uniref:Uncharacterized protein n=1 Tax=Panagrolaimus sp. ES5 TaxID=591445 RepID=A0AC34GHK1_9BILA